MISINLPLKFEIDSTQSTITTVNISGAFRRGQVSPEVLQKYMIAINDVEKRAAHGIVIFDLSGLKYWDTLGINAVVPLVERVNDKYPNRSGLVLSEDSNVFRAAQARHKLAFENGKIFWSESKKDLLRQLTGEG